MDTISILTIVSAIISVIFAGAFFYENKKRLKNKSVYNILRKEFAKLDERNKIQSQIINCANKALEDEEVFENSMKELANTLRTIFKSEYCAIGKLVNDIVEDYAFDYEKHDDFESHNRQISSSNEVRRVNINNTEYLVCEALKNKKQPISIYDEGDINQCRNRHYELYKKTILKSGKLFNTAIIPLRDKNLENDGYIQFINSKDNISIDDINPFQDGLLQLVQMAIKKEKDKKKLEENRKFIDDSNFIKKIIQQKDNVETLLDGIMEYLSKEFNAAVISFRIPVLNGYKREPLFYLRKCYVNSIIQNQEQVKKHYNEHRVVKNKKELGGYDRLKCCNNGAIMFENSMDSDYYSDLNLDLKEQTIIMPVLRDIGKHKCLRIEQNPICEYPENPECVERFKKLYGLFKLRIFKSESKGRDIEVIQKEEECFAEEAKKRLSYLSGQITLILNSIVDKYENDSLKILRENLSGQQFLKIRDFDKQFADTISKSTHAKQCSIYRFVKAETENYPERIYLSATTAERILYKGDSYPTEKIIPNLYFSASDKDNIIVRVFKEKKSKYLYNFRNGVHSGDFTELIDSSSTSIQDESIFLIPIIKKDEEKTCLGVVVLLGKQKHDYSISTSYWEQDKGLVEFLVEIFTRISEADNERSTFLNQLAHELSHPINDMVGNNGLFVDRYEINNESFNKATALRQLKSNINTCLLFKYIILDVEHIYSSSKSDIQYNIELQSNSSKILNDIILLLEQEAQFDRGIVIERHISEMPALYMDKYRIMQVFINILKNAIRYSYRGQPIEIYYKLIETNDSKKHEIKFVNYGIGILDEDKDRIFNLYTRGKNASQFGGRASGSGMGLYIVKEIMKAHGGDCIVRKLKDPTEISLIFPDKIN